MTDNLLDVKDLKISFQTGSGQFNAVDGVSFAIKKGETLGVVGESGCGKSVTALSILQLIQCPPGEYSGGQILFKGKNLLTQDEKYMCDIRGNEIAMIFQEPMTSLNPAYTIGVQIGETLRIHKSMSKKVAGDKTLEMLKLVGIPAPHKRMDEYPHQLSGGMRQRVMIAMALACNPDLIIADEPTTALDVTIQAQILELLSQFKNEFDMAIMMISHDLGVIAEVCDQVAVFYAGMIVEYNNVRGIFKNPLHPYTIGLQNSIPRIDQSRDIELEGIRGSIPDPGTRVNGCPFQPRCDFCEDICANRKPDLFQIDELHQVRCWMYSPEFKDRFAKTKG